MREIRRRLRHEGNTALSKSAKRAAVIAVLAAAAAVAVPVGAASAATTGQHSLALETGAAGTVTAPDGDYCGRPPR